MRPPGWAGRIITPIGPENSTPFAGSMVKWFAKITVGERVRLCVNSADDEAIARDYLSKAQVDLSRVDFLPFKGPIGAGCATAGRFL